MSDGFREELAEQIAENYEKQTGRSLPDHVLENLDVLGCVGRSKRRTVGEYRQVSPSVREQSPTPGETVAFIGCVGASGLAGVYASRWFGGYFAQLFGGVFIAMAAFAILWFAIRWVMADD